MNLPETIKRIHKSRQPKNWSYPVQTGELVDGLDLAKSNHPIQIFYDHSTSNIDSFLTITWNGRQSEPCFHISVRLVPSKERQFWNKLMVEEVLPVINNWVHSRHSPKAADNVAMYCYNQGCPGTVRVEILNNNTALLWEKEWERPKER